VGDVAGFRNPAARAADQERIAWLRAGDHARVIDTMPDFLRVRPEAKFAHYLDDGGGARRAFGACSRASVQ
jgi:3,4-dihydroxyphenylacetate 2,3-dioxygenase